MAMELHVLSDRRLSATVEWQNALDIEGYPLRLDGETSLAAVDGLVPAALNGEQAGFECFNDKASETTSFLGSDHFDRRWKYALGFRWRGSNFEELQAAWMAATAYAAATDGIIFDHEEGKIFTPQQAREQVAKFVNNHSRIKATLENIKQQFSTKP